MSTTILLILVISLLLKANGKWVQSPTTIPRGGDYQMAIGKYRDAIYLIGGGRYEKQLIEYNITKNTFTNDVETTLTHDTYGAGQYYDQVQNVLYMIDPSGAKLSVFNLETQEFINNWRQISIPISVTFWGCLAATNNYIFITGGVRGIDDYILNSFQILDLSSNIWINNAPNMNRQIRGHSCVVHPSNNQLYTIGGAITNGVHSNRIEYISISNIQQINTYSWKYLSDTLTSEAGYTRSVIYNDKIFIIGGLWQTTVTYWLDTVHIIDINTQTVSLGEQLQYPVYGTSAIIVNNIIYAFGGYNSNTYLDSWQYFDLPNTAPTVSPTVLVSPTVAPIFTMSVTTVSSQTNSVVIVMIVVAVLVVIILIISAVLLYFCFIKTNNKAKKDSAIIKQEIVQIQPIASAPEEDTYITEQLPEKEDKVRVLLEKWNLKEYYNGFNETGWDDALMWRELIKYEYKDQLDSIFKLKTGHKAKFVKYVKEEFNIDASGEGEGLGGGHVQNEGDGITLQ